MARILVIDDDQDFRTYVAAILEQNGHDVFTAGNGRLLVRALRRDGLRGKFDVAVVDILMPEVSGFEVISTLKEAHPSAKIVAVSGGGPDSSVWDRLASALNHGAAATLAKPFTSLELCGTVERTLGHA